MNYYKKFFYWILHLFFLSVFIQAQNNFNSENNVDDDIFDEQKARNLVKLLLENDIRYYKSLIPTIDSLSSDAFMNLFEGKSDCNLNIKKCGNIKKLAHKFEHFYVILYEFYKYDEYYKYLIELWVEYPNMEKLQALGDAEKISSKLSSILPNYSSWDDNFKQQILILIRNINLNNEEIKKTIEKELPEIHEILNDLVRIHQEFLPKSYNEYLNKNQNLFNDYFQKFSEYQNKPFSEEIKEKIFQKLYQEVINFVPDYFEKDLKGIIKSILKGTKLVHKANLEGVIELYLEDSVDEHLPSENGNIEYNDNKTSIENKGKIDENSIKLQQWVKVAIHFIHCINSGKKLYDTIQLSKNIKGDNEYQKRLNEITKEFERFQKSKLLDEDDIFESSKIIKNLINNLENIRIKLLKLIKDLKEEIEENENKKNKDWYNIIGEALNIGYNIYSIITTENPLKYFNYIDAILSLSNIAITGVDISYLNGIIYSLEEVYNDSIDKNKLIENEMISLNNTELEINKAYPKNNL